MTHPCSPVPTARSLRAEDVRAEDLVLGHTQEGDFPLEVVSVAPGEMGGVVVTVRFAAGDSPQFSVPIDLEASLVALPRHHGVCVVCGRMAPCPDELAERRLEDLYECPVGVR